MPSAFRGQNYSSIRKDCLSKGILFEDPEFPATSKSLYFSKIENEVEWMRPKELCKVPRLIVDGISCDDLVTGELRNAWFITACTALAHEPKLWYKVVPDAKAQEFDEKNEYAGIFHFQFWRFGEWVDVVIDDRLPTKDGKLIFLHSKQKNEFWSALLEKAYAKLYGDYESLGAGHASDALVDFTGGVSEKLDIKAMNLNNNIDRKNFFQKLESAYDNKALINCHIRVPIAATPAHTAPAHLSEVDENGQTVVQDISQQPSEEPQQQQQSKTSQSQKNMKCDPSLIGSDGPQGLLIGQGYNVTSVQIVEVKKSLQGALGGDNLLLIRLFNPWQTKEWTGPWSDNSPEWKKVAQSEWEKMGVKFENEGEFWMHFDDFITHFTDVDICHFVNTSFFTLKKTWQESVLFSQWSAAGRNGGNNYESATFLSNPQYMFDITSEEPDVIMVSVEQRDVTAGRVAVGDEKNVIGFYIMKVEVNRQFRVHIQGEKMCQSQFLKSRNVFGTCTLPKGRYVIIPCCENKGAVGEFMLRLYTANKASARELDKECPSSGCCSGKHKLVTTLIVEMADGLELPEGYKGSLDPYVVVKCEGEKVQSDFKKNTRSPQFDLMATFYRKKPAQPIIVEVMNHNRMFDDYLCEARIDWPGLMGEPEPGNEKGEKKVFNFYGRKKEADVVKPGNLHVYVRSSDDMTAL